MSHLGADPGHGGLTEHFGDRENCLSPDCRSSVEETAQAFIEHGKAVDEYLEDYYEELYDHGYWEKGDYS